MCIEMGFSYSSHHSFLKNFKTNKVRFVVVVIVVVVVKN